MTTAERTLDEAKLESFLGSFIGDFGGSISISLVYLGDRLGLYKAMAGAGPLTSSQLAEKTDTHERYIRDWLNNMAGGGYVEYDASAGTYELPPEQAFVFANSDSPVFMGDGALGFIPVIWAAEERMLDAFKTGAGIPWGEHDSRLFSATEQFFRPGYRANLTESWIPALDGVHEKLQNGARVADVGCGHGASAVVMAEAYPNSSFTGFDFHAESINTARERAARAGVSDRVSFEVAPASEFTGGPYDLICFFDCVHDMGDPVGAVANARKQIASDGTLMLVEPFAGDKPEDNHNPLGRLFYGASAFFCTANSLSQEVGAAIGAQAGEARLGEVCSDGGFTKFRRATETPFNLVLEARP